MKKYIFAAVICAVSFFGLNIESAAATVSTNTAVEWPDYHSKSWKLIEQVPLTATVSHTIKNNDYVLGPGKYQVRIGTVTMYVDATESMQIDEGSVFGNGPVFRVMFMAGIPFPIDVQFNVNGKWTSIPKRSRLAPIAVIDEEALITKNTLVGVIMTIINEDGAVVLKLKLMNNKNKR